MQNAGLGQKSPAWCKRPASGRPGVALGGRQSVSEQNPTKTNNKASITSAASQLPSRRDSRLRGWPLSMRETWTPPAPVSPRRGRTHPLPLAVDPGAHLFARCLPHSQILRSRRSFRPYQTNVVPIPGPPEGPSQPRPSGDSGRVYRGVLHQSLLAATTLLALGATGAAAACVYNPTILGVTLGLVGWSSVTAGTCS